MTKENAKYYLPFVQAMAEGKTVQLKVNNNWHDCSVTGFDNLAENYRIKPEPKYRPWKPEEAIMRAVRDKSGSIGTVIEYSENNGFWVTAPGAYISAESLLKNWTQLDGSPCGVQE